MLGLCVSCLLLAAPVIAAENLRPNFIIVVADHLGHIEFACYGHKIVHYLDHFAAEGVKFTSYYTASAVCSPASSA